MITKRTKTISIISTVIFLGSAIVFGGLLYAVSVRQMSLQELAREQSVAEAKRNQLTALADLVENTKEDRETLTSYVVAENSVIDFLSLIEETARGQGLAIETQSLNVRPLNEDEIFELLTLTARVEGPLDGVLQMGALFESLPYQVTVSSVTFENVGRNNTGTAWKGIFNIEVTKKIES